MATFPQVVEYHDQIKVQSDNWANWSVEILSTIGTMLNTMSYNIGWDAIPGAVPLAWSAYQPPTTMPDIDFMSLITGGPDGPPVLDEYPPLPDALVYVSETADAITALVTQVLAGAPVIGDDVFYGIYGRAATDQAATFTEEVATLGNAFGRRSWLPADSRSAAQALALAEARKGAQRVARETSQRHAAMTREDFWKASEQGGALERMRGDFFYQGNESNIKRLQAVIEQNKVLLQEFSALWTGVKTYAELILAAMGVTALPKEQRLKSEQARAAIEGAQLAVAADDAKMNLSQGTTKFDLAREQMGHIASVGGALRDALAHVAAQVTGSYLSAGAVTLHGSASGAHVVTAANSTTYATNDARVESTTQSTSSSRVDAHSDESVTKGDSTTRTVTDSTTERAEGSETSTTRDTSDSSSATMTETAQKTNS